MLRIRRTFNLFIHQCSLQIKKSQFYLIVVVVVVSRLHLPSEYEYRVSGHNMMIQLPNGKDGLKPIMTLYSNCLLFVQIISFMDIEYADNDIGRFDGWMDCACE